MRVPAVSHASPPKCPSATAVSARHREAALCGALGERDRALKLEGCLTSPQNVLRHCSSRALLASGHSKRTEEQSRKRRKQQGPGEGPARCVCVCGGGQAGGSQRHSTGRVAPTLASAPAAPASFTWAPTLCLCRETAPVKPHQPKDRTSEECDKD